MARQGILEEKLYSRLSVSEAASNHSFLTVSLGSAPHLKRAACPSSLSSLAPALPFSASPHTLYKLYSIPSGSWYLGAWGMGTGCLSMGPWEALPSPTPYHTTTKRTSVLSFYKTMHLGTRRPRASRSSKSSHHQQHLTVHSVNAHITKKGRSSELQPHTQPLVPFCGEVTGSRETFWNRVGV